MLVDYINEKLSFIELKNDVATYNLQHTPIPGTITGSFTINTAFYTFVVQSDGKVFINPVPEMYSSKDPIKKITVNNSEIYITWRSRIGENLEVQYEYESAIQNIWDKKSSEAVTVSVINYNAILGDTLKEKSEAIYLKIVELTSVMVQKNTSGYFWIITSSWLLNILSCRHQGFFKANEYIPIGENVTEEGILDRKYKIYTAKDFPYNKILIGVGNWETCQGINMSSLKIDGLKNA